ncbi:MAG: glycosyltransferase [Candidatus Omnitrophica bacterium]|nr:glycosyltransferase [Candidatus Omnitrophota bacterium]
MYVTAGAGHRRAAEAIAEAATSAFPQAKIQCRDLLEMVPGWLRRGYPGTYYVLIRHFASVWGACFELLDRRLVYALVQPLRRAWNCLVARRFIRQLKADPPGLIITTHFFPTDVVVACREAGWLRAPLVVAVTDLYPHRFWLSPRAEAYVFATKAGALTAERRGIRPNRLHVLGIPIARAFSATFEPRDLERLFGLSPDRRTVLVTSGATTVGPFERVVEALIGLETSLPGRIQLLVVCGENAAAVRRLQARAGRAAMPVKVFGFIDTMPEAMAASDLIVAKAGGLTVTEALGRGVPLVLYHTIPGQERLNAQYASRHGAALIARDPAEVAAVVRRCFEEPERLSAMRKAAEDIRRPDAAEAIISQVVKPLLTKALEAEGSRLEGGPRASSPEP